MKSDIRRCKNDDDFWKVRAFLRETFLLHEGHQYNWPVARLDYFRWHVSDLNETYQPILEKIFLWEFPDGQLEAVLNPEDPGNAFLQTHPSHRTSELEESMIEFAEEQISVRRENHRVLAVWADARDSLRREILIRRGYRRGKWTETQWRRDLSVPIPDFQAPFSYTIRSLADETELPARSWASWRGFHPDAPDEDYQGWEWYHNIQNCPLYRRDLDIVAVAPGGEIASFCTFWYDDVTRSAMIEPVATVPEHQRLGLARACINEGLRRVQKLGAAMAFVSGFEPAANALYASVLSSAHDEYEQWVKKW